MKQEIVMWKKQIKTVITNNCTKLKFIPPGFCTTLAKQ